MTIFMSVLAGAAIGSGVAIVIYILGFCIEFIACSCNLLSCDLDADETLPFLWSWASFANVFIFCLCCGAIVGLIYGIYKVKVKADEETARKYAEHSEEARKQRIKQIEEVKREALRINNICEKNKAFDKPLVSTEYYSNIQMEKIIKELLDAIEIQGKVESIADELIKKGSA